MVDVWGMIPAPLLSIVAGLSIFGVLLGLGFTLRGFVLDYGWHPRAWWRSWRFAHTHRLVWWRRPAPVYHMSTRIYCGLPGSGKTLLATYDAIRLLRRGVRVVSNFRIVDPLTGRRAILLRSWFDMLAYSVDAAVGRRPTVFVLDEIHLWASARMFAKTPAWWLGLMAQHRHFGVAIIGTCQHVNQVEVALRRLVGLVVAVRPMIHSRIPILRTWTAPMAALGKEGEFPPDARQALRVVPWWVYGGYNTKELVAVEEWQDTDDIKEQVDTLVAIARREVKVDRFPTVMGDVDLTVDDEERDALLVELLDALEADPLPAWMPPALPTEA